MDGIAKQVKSGDEEMVVVQERKVLVVFSCPLSTLSAPSMERSIAGMITITCADYAPILFRAGWRVSCVSSKVDAR